MKRKLTYTKDDLKPRKKRKVADQQNDIPIRQRASALQKQVQTRLNQNVSNDTQQPPQVQLSRLNRSLFIACEEGDVDQFKVCIQKGANPRARTVENKTVLYSALRGGNTTIITHLINECHVGVCDSYSIVASKLGNLEAAKILMAKGANPNHRDYKGRSLLHIAVYSGNLDLVKYLLEEQGLDINARDNTEQNGLHYAAFKGDLDMVRYLVSKGIKRSQQSAKGFTPFYIATACQKWRVANYLDELDFFDIIAKRFDNPTTSLHEACFQGNFALVQYLVEEKKKNVNDIQKKRIDLVGKTYNTPLHEAIIGLYLNRLNTPQLFSTGLDYAEPTTLEMQLKIIAYLISQGAKVNLVDECGNTPLHYAARYGYLEIVKAIVETGSRVKIDSINVDGLSPIAFAFKHEHISVVEYLLLKESKGLKPLFVACYKGNVEKVEQILNAAKGNIGKLLNTADPYFMLTPLHVASYRGHFEVVKLLIKRGANGSLLNNQAYTPFDIAYVLHSAKIQEKKDEKDSYGNIVEFLMKNGEAYNRFCINHVPQTLADFVEKKVFTDPNVYDRVMNYKDLVTEYDSDFS